MTIREVGLIGGCVAAMCAPALAAQCDTIDAVTSSTFTITGGQACSTYAKLNWKFDWKNGTMIIRWGKTTSYGSQKSVYAANPISITGLTRKTRYYYAVDGTWEGQSYAYMRDSFTTSGGNSAIRPPAFSNATDGWESVKITIGNNGFIVPVKAGQTVVIELVALNGTAAGDRFLLSAKNGNSQTGQFRNVSPGVYLIKASWPNGFEQQKVFIGK